MEKFENNLEELRNLIIDPYNYVFKYTGTIMHKIDLDREVNKKLIDDSSLFIISEVEHFREQCKKNLKSDGMIKMIENHKAFFESIDANFEKMNVKSIIYDSERESKANLFSSKCRNLISSLKEKILEGKSFSLKSFPPILEHQLEKK